MLELKFAGICDFLFIVFFFYLYIKRLAFVLCFLCDFIANK